jgi:hypothetical protein
MNNVETAIPTWTQDDYDKGWCSSWHIGTPIDPGIWNGRDFREGRCGPEQIDKPKLVALQGGISESGMVPGPRPTDLFLKLNLVREGLLNWIINYPGGPEKYFKDNPAAGVKVLVRMLGGTPSTEPNKVEVNLNLSWLSADRLSYKKNGVIDAEPVLKQDLLDDLIPR